MRWKLLEFGKLLILKRMQTGLALRKKQFRELLYRFSMQLKTLVK